MSFFLYSTSNLNHEERGLVMLYSFLEWYLFTLLFVYVPIDWLICPGYFDQDNPPKFGTVVRGYLRGDAK